MTGPQPYFDDGRVQLFLGDCLDVLAGLPDNSIDSIVTDPPYGLAELSAATVLTAIAAWMSGDRTHVPNGRGFMGREWDRFVPPPGAWDECMRVLKPGGYLLSFAGSRTVDLMTLSIRIAGFEIRDGISWLYGSGYPKSLDVSKAIDKAAVAAPLWDEIRAHLRRWRDMRGLTNAQLNEAVGGATNGGGRASAWLSADQQKPELPSKDQWARLREVLGWERTHLDETYDAVKDGADRPVLEERASSRHGGSWADQENAGMFRKGDVNYVVTTAATENAERWRGWGTALKPAHEPIVVARKPLAGTVSANVLEYGTGALNIDGCRVACDSKGDFPATKKSGAVYAQDAYTKEWAGSGGDPHSEGRWPPNVLLSEEVASELDRQSGVLTSGANLTHRGSDKFRDAYGEFAGQRECVARRGTDTGGASRFFPVFRYEAKAPASERPRLADGTAHNTVKPLELMRWLVRLVTPPGGTVGDFFAGSGTTGEACLIEGFNCILAEKDPASAELIKARLSKPIQPVMFGEAS
jgi:DNA modification methylase